LPAAPQTSVRSSARFSTPRWIRRLPLPAGWQASEKVGGGGAHRLQKYPIPSPSDGGSCQLADREAVDARVSVAAEAGR
jgi:hypothetical protein